MADGGRVSSRGRFRPGQVVTLVKVAGEGVLRAEGGEVVAQRVVDEDGLVEFLGLEVDARYFLVGQAEGEPVEIRVRGLAEGEESPVLSQPPVGLEPQRRADGSLESDHVVTPPVVVEAAEDGSPKDAAPIPDGAVFVPGSSGVQPPAEDDVEVDAQGQEVDADPAPAEDDPGLHDVATGPPTVLESHNDDDDAPADDVPAEEPASDAVPAASVDVEPAQTDPAFVPRPLDAPEDVPAGPEPIVPDAAPADPVAPDVTSDPAPEVPVDDPNDQKEQ